MTPPRYVKSPEQLARAADNNAEFLPSTAEQLVVDYCTDFDVAAAVVPKPLEVDERAVVHIGISQVEMHLPGGINLTIGSGVVGMHYELVNTDSNGQVLRSVPADWLYPFVHQRYDDFAAAMAG